MICCLLTVLGLAGAGAMGCDRRLTPYARGVATGIGFTLGFLIGLVGALHLIWPVNFPICSIHH